MASTLSTSLTTSIRSVAAPAVDLASGLLREFRKRDPNTPVTLITADDGRVYSKPNLSNALALGRTAE